MTDKNVQFQDQLGNKLYPKTKGSLVFNDKNEALGGVEAGAQVNKIEKITLNGQEISIVNKAVEITLPAQAEYTMVKQATAEDGMASTYYLAKDGVQVGEKINIAKDQVLENVERKVCAEAGKPVAGYKKGDVYFEFTFQNVEKHLYLNAQEFVDEYTGGNGIIIENNEVRIDTSVVATQTDLTEGLAGKEDVIEDLADIRANASAGATQSATNKTAIETINNSEVMKSGINGTKVSAYEAHLANDTIHVTANDKIAWSKKQEAIADLETIRSNATAGKGASDTIATYGDIVSHNAEEFYTKTDINNMNLITYVELA